MAGMEGNTPRPPASANNVTRLWPIAPALVERIRRLPDEWAWEIESTIVFQLDALERRLAGETLKRAHTAEVLKFTRKKRRTRRA